MIMNFVMWVFPWYLVAFALLAFLPRWRWLLPASLLAMAFCLYEFHDIARADGPGLALGVAILMFGSLGFAFGFLARSVVLVGTALRWEFARPMLILPVAFVAGFGGYIGILALGQATRPAPGARPDAACVECLHAATLGDVKLAIPLAPAISVMRVGDGAPGDHFDSTFGARRYCDLTNSSTPRLQTLHLNLRKDSIRHKATQLSAFCATPRPFRLWPLLCGRQGADASPYDLDTLSVSLVDHAGNDMQRMRERAGKLAAVRLAEGIEMYWPASDVRFGNVYFTRTEPVGYIAECYGDTYRKEAAVLTCTAIHPLAGGLKIAYGFTTRSGEFTTRSIEVEKRARAIFRGLLDPRSETPSP